MFLLKQVSIVAKLACEFVGNQLVKVVKKIAPIFQNGYIGISNRVILRFKKCSNLSFILEKVQKKIFLDDFNS